MSGRDTPEPDFRMQEWLVRADLASIFRPAGRLHIPNFLERAGATELYRHLAGDIDWSMVLHDGKDVREALPAMRKAFPQLDHELAQTAYASAHERFQFLYEVQRTPDDAIARGTNPTALNRFVDFLNSSAFLAFARRLSGIESLDWADAQATCYRSGHFLTVHNDYLENEKRRVAYVYNLAPEWRSDWGGLLQFIGPLGHVLEAYTPRFNSLNVFTVPQLHSVSMVAPFAAGPRYSITGWLRER
jgi:SM-20-related protein